MNRCLGVGRWVVLAALVLVGPSCLAAAAVGAGAGAAGAVAWTSRGATSRVQGSVEEVFNRSAAVFREMGITQTGQTTEDNGAERKLIGTKGELEVTVQIERDEAATSKVEVYARKSPVEWDRNLARDVLTRIVSRS